MKKLKILLVFAVLTSISIPGIAGQLTSESLWLQDRHHRHRHPTVGAPLDGGILAALGAAGVGYLIARRRKKNNT